MLSCDKPILSVYEVTKSEIVSTAPGIAMLMYVVVERYVAMVTKCTEIDVTNTWLNDNISKTLTSFIQSCASQTQQTAHC